MSNYLEIADQPGGLSVADLVDEIWPVGHQATTENERALAVGIVERLTDALWIEPATRLMEISKAVQTFGAIERAEDRDLAAKLYADVIAGKKQTTRCTAELPALLYRLHKASVARQSEALRPWEDAEATMKRIIADDQRKQAQAAEINRARLQAEADRIARAEQAAREAAARAELQAQQETARIERQARMDAEAKAATARGAAQKEAARIALLEAEQREWAAQQERDQAQYALEHTKSVQVEAPVLEAAPVQKVAGVRTLKPKWLARVVDISQIPIEYILADQKALDSAAKNFAPKNITIPGVEFYQDAGGVATKGGY